MACESLNMTCLWPIIRSQEGHVKYATQIRPITYLKAHAAEIVRTMSESAEPMIITQNGEAKVVMQDIASYEQGQEILALLKILALGSMQIEEGRVQNEQDVFQNIRARKTTER